MYIFLLLFSHLTYVSSSIYHSVSVSLSVDDRARNGEDLSLVRGAILPEFTVPPPTPSLPPPPSVASVRPWVLLDPL
jgi:hypothetical protein